MRFWDPIPNGRCSDVIELNLVVIGDGARASSGKPQQWCSIFRHGALHVIHTSKRLATEFLTETGHHFSIIFFANMHHPKNSNYGSGRFIVNSAFLSWEY